MGRQINTKNDSIVAYIRDNGYAYDMKTPSDSNIVKFGNRGVATEATGVNRGISTTLQVPAGKIYLPSKASLICQCEKDVLIQLRLSYLNGTNKEITISDNREQNTYTESWIAFKAGELTKEIDISSFGIMREFSYILIQYYVSTEAGSTVIPPFIQLTTQGIMIDDDINFFAKNKILFITDSYGHTNSTDVASISPFYKPILGKQYFPKVFRDLVINNLGIDTQIINKGFGGASTTLADILLDFGYYSNIEFNSIVISLGFNDASGSWDPTKRNSLKNNIRKLVNLRLLRNANASVFLCLPYPAVNTDTNRNATYLTTTKIQDIRDAISEVANEFGESNKVYIVNFSTAYPNTDYTKYSANPGDAKTHPSSLGHIDIANILYNRYVSTL